MHLSQKTKKTIFVDYIPAELKQNKVWVVEYYVLNPYSENPKLERRRNRVKKLKTVKLRKELAKQMIDNINHKLKNGWNPFTEKPKTKHFTPLSDVKEVYINQLKKDLKDDVIRIDTFKTYSSRMKVFIEYLNSVGKGNLLAFNLTDEIIGDFLDHLRHVKDLAARSRDNYFTAIQTFTQWALKKKYLNYCPCEGFSKINKTKTVKNVIPEKERLAIFNYYKENNINFLTMCMVCYYCLVRRTELTKLRVKDVSLLNKTLFIEGNNSKNHKSAHVTMPDLLIDLLANHIKNANSEDLIFSNDNYSPGKEPFLPNKLSSNWARMRKKVNIDMKYKWYDLKASGITDLIISGVPLLSVRDQARHYSIKQTDEYTPRNMKKADTNILNSGVNFKTK